MAEDYQTVLLKVCAASLFSSYSLQAAKELLGKSYFALAPVEKTAVDQAAFALLAANFQALNEEALKKAIAAQPVGFQPPSTQVNPPANSGPTKP